ncbi:MAG: YIP1 family protein [Acidobacteriota bacterium]
MTHTNASAGASPAPKNLIARLIGIIVAPRATYESVVAHPTWFGMMALTTVLVAGLIGGFLMTKVGQEAWLDAASSSPGVTAQAIEGMQKMAPYVGYITAASMLIFMPIIVVVMAGILYAVFNAALGGNATFKQVVAVVVHAGPIGVLSQLFTVPLNYARGSMTSGTSLYVLVQSFVDETSFLGRFLGMIEIFLVWQLIVLSIGLAVLYRRKTQPIATSLLALFVVIAVIVAFIRRGAGA